MHLEVYNASGMNLLIRRNAGLAALFFCAGLFAAAAFADEKLYEGSIKPLLAEKCAACHGALKQEAGLRLDYGRGLQAGGESGPILDFEQADASELVARVKTKDLSSRMPPEHEGAPLDDADIQLLIEWIEQGAKFPATEKTPQGPDDHWAYQPVVRPAIPEVVIPETTGEDGSWTANPIDAFVFSKLTNKSMRPLGLAEPEIRLRRLYFDLVGLPPTPEQLSDYAEDPTREKWESIAGHLLEQQAHGERWARHWMDVWRYSDWDGFKNAVRGSQRHIWRWRDWIVESLNGDKGYDRMLVEMLAGDEIAPEDPQTLRATGFLARNFHHSNRNIWLDATVEHTAKAFMATTLNCARCHDHKYDPLSQESFYAFRAIFEPHQVRTERVPGQPNTTKNGLVRAYDADLNEPTYLFVGGNEKQPDKSHPIDPGVPGVLGGEYEPSQLTLPPIAAMPSLREYVEQEDLKKYQNLVSQARKKLQALAKVEKQPSKQVQPNAKQTGDVRSSQLACGELELAKQRLVTAKAELDAVRKRWRVDRLRYEQELPWQAEARSAERAERRAAGAKFTLEFMEHNRTVCKLESQLQEAKESEAKELNKKLTEAKKALEKLEQKKSQKRSLAQGGERPPRPAKYTSVGKRFSQASTGRRLALANWLVNSENPLTARVAVNYVWMHYFGEPLVASVDDFGMRCAEPIHRDLLDWLAAELMENSWSLKHLHRLIVSSRAYQLASSPIADSRDVWNANVAHDKDNRLLWRANIRRLDAEAIRDSLLSLSGNLEYTVGGPEIDFGLGETNYRRSLYFRTAYEKQMTMMVVFDAASPNECYRRSPSVIPQQALALANSALALDQSRAITGKIMRELATISNGEEDKSANDAFIARAFVALLARNCSPAEMATCREFLQQQEQLLIDIKNLQLVESKNVSKTSPASDPAVRARENLVHTLVNHNDFVTVR